MRADSSKVPWSFAPEISSILYRLYLRIQRQVFLRSAVILISKDFLTILRAIFIVVDSLTITRARKRQQNRWIFWIKAAIRIRKHISSCNRCKLKEPAMRTKIRSIGIALYMLRCLSPVKTTRVRRPHQDCARPPQPLNSQKGSPDVRQR